MKGQKIAAVLVGIVLLAFVFIVSTAVIGFGPVFSAMSTADEKWVALQDCEKKADATPDEKTRAAQLYNQAAARYNAEIAVFPTRLITWRLDFQPRPYRSEAPTEIVVVSSARAWAPGVFTVAFCVGLVLLMWRRG